MLPICKQNITEVWSYNLIKAFKNIKDQIKNTSFVAFDSEYPGPLLPRTREIDEWTYINGTVPYTNPIQFGLAFYGEFGNKIIPINTWQINFQFDEDTDKTNPEGIKFLKEHGFDFNRHKNEGCTPGCLHERTAFALRNRYIYIYIFADIYVYLSTTATIRTQRQRSGNRTSKCQCDATRDNTRRWQRDSSTSSSYRARARRARAQHSAVVRAAQRVVEPRRGGSGASIDFRQNAVRGAHHQHYYIPACVSDRAAQCEKAKAHCASIIGIWSTRTWLRVLCIRCLLPESHRVYKSPRGELFFVTFIIIICYTFQRAANYINISHSCGKRETSAEILMLN
uniref:poly(A)-specific ribonuclease n=1 Tax=Trichogramma kaykai TaxID=54128 RepID=A0ABD2X385_9HYME